MKTFLTIAGVLILSVVLFFAFTDRKDNNQPFTASIDTSDKVEDADHAMILAAKELIATLSEEEKENTVIDFSDDERKHWNYVPMNRKGLRYRDMSDDQKSKTKALLKSGLSQKGFEKAESIMALEIILGDLEGTGGPNMRRDPEKYWVAIFGEPSAVSPWGWRFEGHHLSINFTSFDNKIIAYTPLFFGSNPGKVPSGEQKGMRVLKEEEDMGRILVKSLNDEQKKKAIIAEDAPDDMFTRNDRKAKLESNEGLPVKEMDEAQKDAVNKLMNVYLGRVKKEVADEHWRKIREEGFENIIFAWAGGLEPGARHYYRLKGPTILIEYDNTQNGANHVHSVVRDISNDWGEDLLHKHYETSEHH